MTDRRYHVIFQTNNGPDGKWLDYCREEPEFGLFPMNEKEVNEWAESMLSIVRHQTNCDARFRIERW